MTEHTNGSDICHYSSVYLAALLTTADDAQVPVEHQDEEHFQLHPLSEL